MSQSKFIGPATVVLLVLAWSGIAVSGARAEVTGGLLILTAVGAALAFMTLR